MQTVSRPYRNKKKETNTETQTQTEKENDKKRKIEKKIFDSGARSKGKSTAHEDD